MTVPHVSGHFRFKRGIHKLLNIGNGAEAAREADESDTALLQRIANLPVEHQVGPAELVDRLLGIADQEQFPGLRPDLLPIRFGRIVAAQQQQDLDLQRIGVLKFVDEQMAEALLQIAANFHLAAEQIADITEQVDKIQLSQAMLAFAIVFEKFRHFLAKHGCQRSVGPDSKLFDPANEFIAAAQQLLPRDSASVFTGPFAPAFGEIAA